MVRALASHQFGSGSTSGLGVICGLSLLLVLVLAPRGFSLGTSCTFFQLDLHKYPQLVLCTINTMTVDCFLIDFLINS